MCSHYGQFIPEDLFPAELAEGLPFGAYPKMPVPVVLWGAEERPVGETMRWGLVPHWARDTKKLTSTFNARGETIHEKPTFKPSFLGGKRCVIPARFFCENVYTPGTRKKIGEVEISLVSGKPMSIAGLWAINTLIEPEPIRSCTMVTIHANATIEPFHHRMPVILTDEDADRWIRPETPLDQLTAAIRPCPPEALQVVRAG